VIISWTTAAAVLTVTVKLQLAVSPTASVTVYVTVVVPIGKTEPLAGPAVRAVVAPGQLSVPTGAVYVAIAPEGQVGSSVILPGQLMLGAWVSLTVTVNEHAGDVLPLASVALQVTVVVPFWNVEPDGGVQLAVAPGQLSFTVAAKLTTAEHRFGSVDLTMLAGQVIVGGVVSLTVKVVVQVALLFAASFTVIVIVVTPFVTSVPAAGFCVAVSEAASVQLSVATTPPITFGTAA